MTVILVTAARLGGAEAVELEVADGTTVETFVRTRVGPDIYAKCMLVNRKPVPWDYVLRHLDKVTLRPFRSRNPTAP